MQGIVSRAVAVALSVCSLAGCGGGGGSSSNPTSPSAQPSSPPTTANPLVITITRQNGSQSFSPNPAAAGGELAVFRNADIVVHRVRLNDGTIDTGDIPPGGTSAPMRMPAEGTNYHCPLHPDMIGAVNAASGEPPPECTGPYCDGY